MTRRREKERAPAAAPSSERLTKTALYSSRSNATARYAEDAPEHLTEVDRLLDASDLVIMNALADGECSPRDALEHTLALHARMRRNLRSIQVAA